MVAYSKEQARQALAGNDPDKKTPIENTPQKQNREEVSVPPNLPTGSLVDLPHFQERRSKPSIASKNISRPKIQEKRPEHKIVERTQTQMAPKPSHYQQPIKEPLPQKTEDYKKKLRDEYLLKTYSYDIAQDVKENKKTLLDVATAGKKEKVIRAGKKDSNYSITKIFLTFFVLLLLIGGVFILWNNLTTEPVGQKPVENVQIIPIQKTKEINLENLNRQEIVQALQIARETSPDITSINLLNNGIRLSAENFLSNIGAPTKLSRNSLEYLLAETSGKRFLMISVSSYEIAYASMLEWRDTVDKDVLEILFQKEATSIIPETQNNQEVFVASSEEEDLFTFGLIDRNTLLIAPSEIFSNFLNK